VQKRRDAADDDELPACVSDELQDLQEVLSHVPGAARAWRRAF
jgi:hypothetical protein